VAAPLGLLLSVRAVGPKSCDSVWRFRGNALLSSLLLLAVSACSASKHREGEWVPYERVNVQLRRAIGMKPNNFVRACGHIINGGRLEDSRAASAQRSESTIRGDRPYRDYRWAIEFLRS
jgi:hypothetical protein